MPPTLKQPPKLYLIHLSLSPNTPPSPPLRLRNLYRIGYGWEVVWVIVLMFSGWGADQRCNCTWSIRVAIYCSMVWHSLKMFCSWASSCHANSSILLILPQLCSIFSSSCYILGCSSLMMCWCLDSMALVMSCIDWRRVLMSEWRRCESKAACLTMSWVRWGVLEGRSAARRTQSSSLSITTNIKQISRQPSPGDLHNSQYLYGILRFIH